MTNNEKAMIKLEKTYEYEKLKSIVRENTTDVERYKNIVEAIDKYITKCVVQTIDWSDENDY